MEAEGHGGVCLFLWRRKTDGDSGIGSLLFVSGQTKDLTQLEDGSCTVCEVARSMASLLFCPVSLSQ